MKSVFFLILIGLCFLIYGCGNSKMINRSSSLKNYALCKCLIYAMPNDSILKKDISASVYRELSGCGAEDLDKIDTLAKKNAGSFLPSPIFDHAGKKAVLMDCISFYKGKTLDSLVMDIIKKK